MERLLNIPSGFTIFGFEIKFYGITMALAYAIALIICIVLCKKKKYSENLPYTLLLIAFPLAVIGGRLGYVLFSGRSWSFMEILDIRSGGLMLYGGIVLAMLGIIVYALIKKKSILKILDLIAPCLILAQAIGRWGNFFNQEAFGYEITNQSFQWFPFGVYIESLGEWHLATFFYESLWCFVCFFVLYNVYKKTNKVGLVTALYLVLYGVERLLIEGLRTDSLYIGSIRVSQLISILMIALGVIYIVYLIVKSYKQKKLAKQKYEELHIYEDTANELKSASYTAPIKQYENEMKIEKAKQEKLKNSEDELKKSNICKKNVVVSNRVEKIKQENKEHKEKLEKNRKKKK